MKDPYRPPPSSHVAVPPGGHAVAITISLTNQSTEPRDFEPLDVALDSGFGHTYTPPEKVPGHGLPERSVAPGETLTVHIAYSCFFPRPAKHLSVLFYGTGDPTVASVTVHVR